VKELVQYLSWGGVERPDTERLQFVLLRLVLRILECEKCVDLKLLSNCTSIFGSTCHFRRDDLSIAGVVLVGWYEEPLRLLMNARDIMLSWFANRSVVFHELVCEVLVDVMRSCAKILRDVGDGGISEELNAAVVGGAVRAKQTLLALVRDLDLEDSLGQAAAQSLLRGKYDDPHLLPTLLSHYVQVSCIITYQFNTLLTRIYGLFC
jgi:hypothetical protein